MSWCYDLHVLDSVAQTLNVTGTSVERNVIMPYTVIIDDRGREWPEPSWALRTHFNLTTYKGDVIEVLLRLVGCVAFTTLGRGRAQVRFNARTVSDVALAQLHYRLFDERVTRVALKSGQAAPVRICGSIGDAIKLIQTIVQQARVQGRPNNTRKQLDINLIDPNSPFGLLLAASSATSGVFNRERFAPILSKVLEDRWILFAAEGDGPDMRIVECGLGYGIPAPTICRQMKNTLLSNAPDPVYARWVATSLERVNQTRNVTFETAKTRANWPGAGEVESEYARLVLPFRGPKSERLLLSASRRFKLRNIGDRDAA